MARQEAPLAAPLENARVSVLEERRLPRVYQLLSSLLRDPFPPSIHFPPSSTRHQHSHPRHQLVINTPPRSFTRHQHALPRNRHTPAPLHRHQCTPLVIKTNTRVRVTHGCACAGRALSAARVSAAQLAPARPPPRHQHTSPRHQLVINTPTPVTNSSSTHSPP